MVARPRSWLVVAAVVALLAVGLIAWRLTGPDRTYTAEPGASELPQADPGGAARVLTAFTGAIADRDADAAAALAPPQDPAAVTLLGQLVDNARALDVVGFTARYVDEAGDVATDGTWPAAVALSWRFGGFDLHPVREEVQVTFRVEHGRVGISGFGGGADRSPLWLSGPVHVDRTDDALVLAATPADAALVGPRAGRAVSVVRRVLPRWQGRLVVEVPASEAQLDRTLAADPESYTAIAAVTAPVDGTLTRQSPIHVFVNPTVYDTLDPVGGQVVLSHEATHVATDAPVTSGLPQWLLEGFADYVALRDVALPLRTTAGQILAEVAKSGPPDHLPGPADFDAHATYLGATYEAAWLVCRELADAGGEPALVRLYQAVSAGAPFESELRRIFGLSPAQLLTGWQDRLQRLADRIEAPA